MITESFSNIYYAIISALTFGLIFSAFESSIRLIFSVICSLSRILPKSILTKTSAVKIIKAENLSIKSRGRASIFLSILFYSIGFSVLSYFALDGVIRLYIIVIYSASVFMSNFAFLKVSKFLIPPFFISLFLPIRFAIRLIATPVVYLFKNLKKEIRRISALVRAKKHF